MRLHQYSCVRQQIARCLRRAARQQFVMIKPRAHGAGATYSRTADPRGGKKPTDQFAEEEGGMEIGAQGASVITVTNRRRRTMAKRKARASADLVESILRLIEAGSHRKLRFSGSIINMKTGTMQSIPDRIGEMIEKWASECIESPPRKKARKKK